jgi:hypothetical protein
VGLGKTLTVAAAFSSLLPRYRQRAPAGKAHPADGGGGDAFLCGDLSPKELSSRAAQHSRWSLDARAAAPGAIGGHRAAVLCGQRQLARVAACGDGPPTPGSDNGDSGAGQQWQPRSDNDGGDAKTCIDRRVGGGAATA